jgi:N-methylhydantoinase A/oxoprolinase/acetone carboxylase beta subunit
MILGIDMGGTHTNAVLIDHFAVLKKATVLTDERNGADLNPVKGAAS